MKQRLENKLIHYGKLVIERQLSYANFGNISIRYRNQILISCKGCFLDLLRKEDLIWVDITTGQVVNKGCPSSELKMHLFSYRANSCIKAIFHLHPFWISLLDKLNIRFKMASQEAQYIFNKGIRYLAHYKPGSEKLALMVSNYIADYDVLILKAHGIVVGADSLELCYLKSLALEREAKLHWFYLLSKFSLLK